MRDFSQILAKALFILASCASECSAFTESSSRQVPNGQAIRSSVGIKNGLVLGPTARNGLGYEDVTLGQGRRILPGDSVLCYYVGSYQNGRFGGETVFDQTRTFGEKNWIEFTAKSQTFYALDETPESGSHNLLTFTTLCSPR